MTSDRDFAEAESLWEFVADPDRPATTDIERTARQVQRAIGPPMPGTVVPRDAMWARVIDVTPTSRPASPSRAATGFIASGGWARQRLGRGQSVISFGLVLMFLASLLVVAHDRVVSPALATATPTEDGEGGMAPLEATPGADGACVAREVTWQEPDFRAEPHYEAVRFASIEIVEQALETYVSLMNCNLPVSFDPENPAESAQALAVRSLVTDRQWNALFGSPANLPPTPPDDVVLRSAVITLNSPRIIIVDSQGPGWSGGYVVFDPRQVYELVDGRFGVMFGIVSSEDFSPFEAGEPNQGNRLLIWVAFAEQDGILFIDEMRSICTADRVNLESEGQSVATPDAEGMPASGSQPGCQ